MSVPRPATLAWLATLSHLLLLPNVAHASGRAEERALDPAEATGPLQRPSQPILLARAAPQQNPSYPGAREKFQRIRYVHLDRNQRAAEYDALCELVSGHFPFLDQKEIEWDTLCRRRREEALDASTQEGFYLVLESLLRHLRDGETALEAYPGQRPRTGIGIALRALDGRFMIDELSPRFPADHYGIERGMEVLAIDGVRTADALEAAKYRGRGYSTVRQQEYEILRRTIFLGDPETDVELQLRDRRGRVVTRWVKRPSPESLEQYRRSAWNNGPKIHAKILQGNLGYLHIEAWPDDTSALRELDGAVTMLQETHGLILDLRNNSRAPLHLAEEASLRFEPPMKRIVLSQDPESSPDAAASGDPAMRLNFPQAGKAVEPQSAGDSSHPGKESLTRPSWLRQTDHPVYSKSVVLILDESVGGANQVLADELRMKGCPTVGRTTSGSVGIPRVFTLPYGGRVRLSVDVLEGEAGMLEEGRGVAADVPASPTRKLYQEDLDEVLEKAREVLIAELRRD